MTFKPFCLTPAMVRKPAERRYYLARWHEALYHAASLSAWPSSARSIEHVLGRLSLHWTASRKAQCFVRGRKINHRSRPSLSLPEMRARTICGYSYSDAWAGCLYHAGAVSDWAFDPPHVLTGLQAHHDFMTETGAEPPNWDTPVALPLL